jgi:hypothetical protein
MTQTSTEPGAKHWWNERMMWLVVGGPLAVVLASFVTLALALKYPDPVLDTSARKASSESADLRAMEPAGKARNHAATGGQ